VSNGVRLPAAIHAIGTSACKSRHFTKRNNSSPRAGGADNVARARARADSRTLSRAERFTSKGSPSRGKFRSQNGEINPLVCDRSLARERVGTMAPVCPQNAKCERRTSVNYRSAMQSLCSVSSLFTEARFLYLARGNARFLHRDSSIRSPCR